MILLRISLLTTLAFTAAFALAACGQDEVKTQTPAQQAPAAQTEMAKPATEQTTPEQAPAVEQAPAMDQAPAANPAVLAAGNPAAKFGQELQALTGEEQVAYFFNNYPTYLAQLGGLNPEQTKVVTDFYAKLRKEFNDHYTVILALRQQHTDTGLVQTVKQGDNGADYPALPKPEETDAYTSWKLGYQAWFAKVTQDILQRFGNPDFLQRYVLNADETEEAKKENTANLEYIKSLLPEYEAVTKVLLSANPAATAEGATDEQKAKVFFDYSFLANNLISVATYAAEYDTADNKKEHVTDLLDGNLYKEELVGPVEKFQAYFK